jgi:hypothetical protein
MTDLKQSWRFCTRTLKCLVLDQGVQVPAKKHCWSATPRMAPIDNLDADNFSILRNRPLRTVRSITEEVGV